MLLEAYASDRYKVMFDETLYPVEVKDGPSGKLRSLHIYREVYKPSLVSGVSCRESWCA